MRASSFGWEIDIMISNEELIVIPKSSLIGKIKRFSDKGFHSEIDLCLSLGKTSKQNKFIDLHTSPNYVYWEQAQKYNIVISHLAYSQLHERHSTEERLCYNPTCKINIRVIG